MRYERLRTMCQHSLVAMDGPRLFLQAENQRRNEKSLNNTPVYHFPINPNSILSINICVYQWVINHTHKLCIFQSEPLSTKFQFLTISDKTFDQTTSYTPKVKGNDPITTNAKITV